MYALIDVSVIMSVFSIDRADDVVNCIESLKKQTLPPKEIVIAIDPNSTLVSYYTKRLGSSVKLVVSDVFGLSAARNMGVKSCTSDFLAFIDDDAVAEKNWLENLTSNFNNPLTIGVGGHIIPVWPDKRPAWLPEELYWTIGCSYKGLPIKKMPIRNPIGCNMAFRRRVFENVGFFRTDMGRVGCMLMSHDDTEFGMRVTATLAGSTIIYDPHAVVHHVVAPHRVCFTYVMRRSYAEGFSKAFVLSGNQTSKEPLRTEKNYLLSLLRGTPQMLLRGNVKTGLFRCCTLWMSTLMVFLGYLVGFCSR